MSAIVKPSDVFEKYHQDEQAFLQKIQSVDFDQLVNDNIAQFNQVVNTVYGFSPFSPNMPSDFEYKIRLDTVQEDMRIYTGRGNLMSEITKRFIELLESARYIVTPSAYAHRLLKISIPNPMNTMSS